MQQFQLSVKVIRSFCTDSRWVTNEAEERI